MSWLSLAATSSVGERGSAPREDLKLLCRPRYARHLRGLRLASTIAATTTKPPRFHPLRPCLRTLPSLCYLRQEAWPIAAGECLPSVYLSPRINSQFHPASLPHASFCVLVLGLLSRQRLIGSLPSRPRPLVQPRCSCLTSRRTTQLPSLLSLLQRTHDDRATGNAQGTREEQHTRRPDSTCTQSSAAFFGGQRCAASGRIT